MDIHCACGKPANRLGVAPSVEDMGTLPRYTAAVAALALLGGGTAFAVLNPSDISGPNRTAGPKSGDRAVTPVGYAVTPAGAQTQVGHLPLNAALHPDGRVLLVTNNGQATQSLQLIDVASRRVMQTLDYKSPESLYIGLAWSPDGKKAYASAAANSKVRTFTYDGSTLTEGKPLTLPTKAPDGTTVKLFPAGLAVTPDGTKVVVAGQLGNTVSIIDVASGKVETTAVGHRPVWVTLSKDGRTAYVSNQGANTVSVVDVKGSVPVAKGTIKVGLHPNKSVLNAAGSRLYVANSDNDTVSEVRLPRGKVARTFNLAAKKSPVGVNPVGLALAPQEKTIYVASSGTNSVDVVSLASGKVTGRIPTAWYPSSVTVAGTSLFVTNAKGYGAGPNDGPGHPNPEASTPTSPDQYSGGMINGTLSVVPVPGRARLKTYSAQVAKNNAPVKAGGSVVPVKPGDASPIKHVIYVVKENRTYDQVMGSLGRGNGDPSLNLFGDESAPNMRELARRFTTLDNFYADAEVSANGWNWVAQANSNPYAEQMWPAGYSGRGGVYPSENNKPEHAAQNPQNTYLWQRFAKAGVSFANFGFYVDRKGDAFIAEDPVLNRETDHAFQGYDLACPDSSGTFTPKAKNCLTPRVDQWLKSFETYKKSGSMPTVQFVRFGNDHTAGTKPGMPTPKAMVADNDYAFGRLVDAVSHSAFWKDTVILATEDDAQNGPDHVDAHRTIAWAISPYTQTGKVDSTFYSTASMVRTIGLFAGIGPLTQFDQYSTPMSRSFTSTPNMAPYQVIKPSYDMTTVNAKTAPMANISAQQALTKEDQIDERTFNQAIWKSVRGADAVMPEATYGLLGDTATAEKQAEAIADANAAKKGVGAAAEDED